ncbi:MAG: flavin reductase family protein [Chloroflexota bacterium]
METATTPINPDELSPRDAYRLLVSIVVPRPIAWVSSLGVDGTPNLAPFSFFNVAGESPPTILFSIGEKHGEQKDTLRNVKETGEFVVNIVGAELAELMNITSGEWPYSTDEAALAGLEMADSLVVKPKRVAAAPVAMEAIVTQIIPVQDTTSTLVLGRVLRYHIRDGLLTPTGLVDPTAMRPLARMGGNAYTTVDHVFDMLRPRV